LIAIIQRVTSCDVIIDNKSTSSINHGILVLLGIEKDDNQTKTSVNIKNDPKCLLVKNKEGKISRNERCEATGKKFKNCCGAL